MTAVDAFTRGRHKLRVLVVSAAPVGDRAPLDLRREWLLLQREARAGEVPALFYRLLPPTRVAFEHALKACRGGGVSPHVVHFAGHGHPHDLAFEDELCNEAPFRRADLAKALLGRGVRLAVLNACHTATRETVSLARYLQEEGAVEAAIGHEHPVPDDAAALFASHVYRGLCRGQTVLDAFAAAESALAKTHPRAAGAAQLFGGDHLRLARFAADVARSPLAFDGTSGRGRMPEVAHFYGRGEELVEVGRFLDDTTLRALAISGVGGIGKTTLAQEAANRHAWRFPGGLAFASIRSFHFDRPTAEALVRSAATTLMVPDASGPAFSERLLGHVRQHPGLLVFDNLEDLADGELERLLRFLADLPLNGTKALLTIRPAPPLLHAWPWVRVRVLTEGLDPRAGAAYAVHIAGARVPEIAAAPRDEAGLYQGLPLQLTRALGGHPEMLNWAVGIAVTRGVPELNGAVTELCDGDPLAAAARSLAADTMSARMEALLTSSLRLLDDESRRLLGVLPMFPDGTFTQGELASATSAYLGSASNDEDTRNEQATPVANRVLTAWRDAGLVREDGRTKVFRVHTVVQGHAARGDRLDRGDTESAFRALLRAALQYVDEHQDSYDELDRRLGHLLGLFEAGWDRDGESEPLRPGIARAIDAMGYFFYHRGYWPIMARWHERLRGLIEDDPTTRARRLYLGSLVLAGQGRLTDARALLREALQVYDDLGDRRGRVAALGMVASIDESQGNLAGARALLREAMQINDELGDRKGRATSQRALAVIEERQGNYAEARARLQESIQIGNEVGDQQDRAASLYLLAVLEYRQGNHAEARAHLSESIQIKDASGDRPGRAGSLHMLAVIEERQGNYIEARTHLIESIEIKDEMGDRYGRATSLHQLAVIEHDQGNYTEARAHLNESIQINEEIGNRQGRAAALHQLASIEESQGNYADAQALLRESIQIKRELEDRKGLAASLHQLASIEEAQGNYTEARAHLNESIQIKDAIGDRPGRATSLHTLAVLEESQGDYDSARTHLRESIRIKNELGDRQACAASLHQLAIIEYRRGGHADARTLLRRSIQIKEEVGDRSGRALSLILLGQLEHRHGSTEDGKDLVREGVAILEELGAAEAATAREVLRDMAGVAARGNTRPDDP